MATRIRRRGNPGSGRNSDAKLWGIGAAAVALVTAGGIVVSLATGTGHPVKGQADSVAASAAPTAAPRGRTVDGVPVGHPRTEAGAKAAGQNYVTERGTVAFLTNTAARHRAVSVMSAVSAKSNALKESDRLASQAAGDLRGDNPKVLPAQSIARTGVLANHVLGFDIHKATLRLWTTTVRGSSAGHAAPKSAFESVTVTLVWEGDDWKLLTTSATGGLVAPVDKRQATNVTADFSEYVPSSAADPIASGTLDAAEMPAPYLRTEHGARAAATSAVALYGDSRFFIDTAWRDRMLAATASPDVLAQVSADATAAAQMVSSNRGLGGDGRTVDGGLLVTRTATLGTRSVAYTDQTASIELWTASLGGIAGADETQRPQVAFLRMTVDLTWRDGTWKTTSVTPSEPLVPSPATATQATPGTAFAEMGGAANAPALA
ncbi:hypothetical protein ACFRJ1_07030 [Streptomyces sp. NPDC056773]|uniref:hypothetical protein n=1 Tax=unclassified Streptomyces TaxID=2593676 RepID=UPI0036B71A54